MDAPLLIVPGFNGSGPDHWQSWLQQQVSTSTRVDGIAWEQPVLAQWAGRVRDVLAKAEQPVWIIAHSFGSLASVVAAADRPEQVAQLILVAPADPARFDCMGLRPENIGFDSRYTLDHALPARRLQVRGLVVASRNDSWLHYDKAAAMAKQWGLALHDAGDAGHSRPATLPAVASANLRKGRGSALAAVRQLTREQMQSPQDHRLWQQERTS